MGHISCSAAIVGLRYGGVASAATLAEKLEIHDHGADQQIVGISTKCPAWNWVIRRNSIGGAGPGQYLGNSDGSAEFVNGLIERNLVRDSIGYAMQIKHQNVRTTGIGEPASSTTIIRHNVFSKSRGLRARAHEPRGRDGRRSAPSGHAVTVNYTTGGGTATPGTDYVPATDLSFPKGSRRGVVRVGILGDTAPQTNETFLVDLAGATNASIAVPQGRGTIVDDDRRGPILGHEPPRH